MIKVDNLPAPRQSLRGVWVAWWLNSLAAADQNRELNRTARPQILWLLAYRLLKTGEIRLFFLAVDSIPRYNWKRTRAKRLEVCTHAAIHASARGKLANSFCPHVRLTIGMAGSLVEGPAIFPGTWVSRESLFS
jgi:hypothetical protein